MPIKTLNTLRLIGHSWRDHGVRGSWYRYFCNKIEILKRQPHWGKGIIPTIKVMTSKELSALKKPLVSKGSIRDLAPYTNKKPKVMQTDPGETDGCVSLPDWRMTQIDGETYQRVLCGLTWSICIFIYGNILCTMHKVTTTLFSPSHNGEYPKILMALTPPFLYKENPCILGI